MKHLSFLFFFILFLHVPAQEVEFRKHKVSYKLSYETLKMKGEKDIGMAGIGADLFIFEKLPNLYLTLNSYSAVAGDRPGLISFGMGAGYVQPLFDSGFALDGGIFIGGGGGANAPDGGGLITREHLNLVYRFGNFSVFGGYSRMDFPTGSMGGNNLNFGLSLFSSFDTAHEASDPGADTETKKSKFRFTMLGTRYLGFSEGPFQPSSSANTKKNNPQLIGIEIDKFINDRFYAALKLNGAVTGGIDGFMNYLIGLGYEQPLGGNALSLDIQGLLGPSGGGAADTGGGLIVQGNLGLRANFGSGYGFKAGLGQSYAPEGNFNGTFFELGLTKSFSLISPESNQADRPYRLKPGEKLHGFGFEFLNRTYFPPNALDKNHKEYDGFFNLLGFQLSKELNKNFSMLGSTYWAYQGSYGAYAEGWLGIEYNWPFAEKWFFDTRLLGGAVGGGGISLGSGLAFQYGAGLGRKVSGAWNISLNAGRMQGLKGNFRPYFLDLGIAYQFGQVSKK